MIATNQTDFIMILPQSISGATEAPQVARTIQHLVLLDDNRQLLPLVLARSAASMAAPLFVALPSRPAAAVSEAGLGTFETCPPILRMSVHQGRPEVAVVRPTDANDPEQTSSD